MNNTLIEWCDASWNPITGCPGPKVSTGCEHCYSERVMNTRLRHLYSEEHPFEHIHFHPDRLGQPRKLKKPSRIFVGSMCDLFHDDVAIEALESVFWEFSKCPQHTFLLLTKRPDKMRWWFSDGLDLGALLPNVWIGVTVCNQDEADEKIPVLLETPAARRFVSVEPMLGPVDLQAIRFTHSEGFFGDALQWHHLPHCRREELKNGAVYPALDWVICGGETGPNARPMHPSWVRSLRDQCEAAGTPFFFKGWGEWGTNWIDMTTGLPAWKMFQGFIHYCDKAPTWMRSGDKLICPDGHIPSHGGKDGKSYPMCVVSRMSKRNAGRLLDGREWNEVPS